ncbi:hypothetical protein [Botrimarina mediterranea]|uniref:PEP-CTERM protein-sorting domain-containing protein n=1 Tax=Botrimarina mediterranea TaxID=2528022 RepID=A0A518KEI7_9BACT|nr:hypothetical protein [Botrimarina mediterranea]QDV76187.1 hypothetical protein Spa11_44120 [Botrimarina mediterranea]
MTPFTTTGLLQFVAALSLIAASSASSVAGILHGHAAAYGGVTGSVPFNNGVGVSGVIDFAVFTAADFNANFAGLGYVPGDAFVYAYQVEATGPEGLSAEIIGVNNPANTIGTFDIGDQDAASASFTPNARWLFAPEIATGLTSWGLAFSSPNLPIVGASLTIGGGTQALIAGVPTPGPISIPEPSALLLLTSGALAAPLSRRARA